MPTRRSWRKFGHVEKVENAEKSEGVKGVVWEGWEGWEVAWCTPMLLQASTTARIPPPYTKMVAAPKALDTVGGGEVRLEYISIRFGSMQCVGVWSVVYT